MLSLVNISTYDKEPFFTAKKEAKRLERLAKAAVKNPSSASGTSSGLKKEKEKKEKREVLPGEEWVNPTPKGEKKGESHHSPGLHIGVISNR